MQPAVHRVGDDVTPLSLNTDTRGRLALSPAKRQADDLELISDRRSCQGHDVVLHRVEHQSADRVQLQLAHVQWISLTKD